MNPTETPTQRMTEAEYLAFEREAAEKHEYVGGTVIRMAGGSKRHIRIAGATTIAIGSVLQPRGCAAHPSDQKVRSPKARTYRYPDLTFVCGSPEYLDEAETILLNPTIIVEVISPSTARTDYGEKMREYIEIASLQDLLLIEQDQPTITHLARMEGDIWTFRALNDPGQSIRLKAVDVPIALKDFYATVDFAESTRGNHEPDGNPHPKDDGSDLG